MSTAIILAGLQFARQLVEALPAIRAALSTEDKDALDAAYIQFMGTSNAVADRLRATPDDPE